MGSFTYEELLRMRSSRYNTEADSSGVAAGIDTGLSPAFLCQVGSVAVYRTSVIHTASEKSAKMAWLGLEVRGKKSAARRNVLEGVLVRGGDWRYGE